MDPSTPAQGSPSTRAVVRNDTTHVTSPNTRIHTTNGRDSSRSSDITSAIGVCDQACKECRRRKARCSRTLPVCDLCAKYRRHCLYEKHARTPLTRKHLTELETRLERAEALVKRMRTLVPPDQRTWESSNEVTETSMGADVGMSEMDDALTAGPSATPAGGPPSLALSPVANSVSSIFRQQLLPPLPSLPPPPPPPSLPPTHPSCFPAAFPTPPRRPPSTLGDDQQRLLESPPHDDFEWCEMENTQLRGLSPEGTGGPGEQPLEEPSPVSDGMASLTVNNTETGYLGVASGAALLRLIEPRSKTNSWSTYGGNSRTNTTGLPGSHPDSHPGMHAGHGTSLMLRAQPNPNRHVTEAMIDAYFRLYHVGYPIIHEPTFRAQYSEVIARPNGSCWTVLAYVVAAIGVWTSASSAADTLDLALFAQARSMLNFDFLEVGNLTLVQALTLASNYQQKRDKPNSGYNYLGLAVRMAMGIGLHKEFVGWNISPLNMEIRRRVWWSLCVFDVGATVTFSRPDVWPYRGVEVAFPLNVHDKDLTAASTTYPPESTQITPYTAVAAQARFHIATHECYERVISTPFPTAAELLHLDADRIVPWRKSLPHYFTEQAPIPPRYALNQAVMAWRLRNLHIIMYRPFVVRRALRRRPDDDTASTEAYECCLADAKETINMIAAFWSQLQQPNRLAAWYSLYFLFQAALIPCICLRNEPASPNASDWRTQLSTTLHTIHAMAPVNASSVRCEEIITSLCERYINMPNIQLQQNHQAHQSQQQQQAQQQKQQMQSIDDAHNIPFSSQSQQIQDGNTVDQTPMEGNIDDSGGMADPGTGWPQPVGESPQTQINSVFSMMWPNMPPLEAANVIMGDDTGWVEFLRAGGIDEWVKDHL